MVTCGLSGGAEGWSWAGCSWYNMHYEVGNAVEMQFADDRWYRGVVADFQRRSRLFKICFEDGDEWRLSLPDPFVRRVAHEGRVGAEKSHCHPPPPASGSPSRYSFKDGRQNLSIAGWNASAACS